MAAGPDLAGVVEQALPNVLPDRIRAVQSDRICLLNFDSSPAAAAGHPQHVMVDLKELLLAGLGPV
jgi:hypothetical protein